VSSNRKPASPKEAPQEPFKRAVAACMRAMAQTPALEVTFSADRPSVIGAGENAKARLPEPPRKLSARDAAIVRGHSDSLALRLACHDDRIHRRIAPQGTAARGVFEAVEQARVEAIGARRMEGVAANLGAMLEDRYSRGNYAEIDNRADAPLALMVRERLTGAPAPKNAQGVVDLWRQFVEERAGAELDRLANSIEDQRAFGKVVHSVLSALDMADDASADSEESEEDSKDESDNNENEDDNGDEQEAHGEAVQMEKAADSEDEMEDGETDAADAPSGEFPPTSSTRSCRPRNSAMRKNSNACAPISTSNCRRSPTSSAGSPIACNAA
jgi:cobaltochelatase CobT